MRKTHTFEIRADGYLTENEEGVSDFFLQDFPLLQVLKEGARFALIVSDKAPVKSKGLVNAYEYDGDSVVSMVGDVSMDIAADIMPDHVRELFAFEDGKPASRWVRLRYNSRDMAGIPRRLIVADDELSFPLDYQLGAYNNDEYGLGMCSSIAEIFRGLRALEHRSKEFTVHAIISSRKRAGFREMIFERSYVMDKEADISAECDHGLLMAINARLKPQSSYWVGLAERVVTTRSKKARAAAKKAWKTRRQNQNKR